MTKLQRKLVGAVTAAALLVNTAGSVFAATTIEISGNGAGSENWTTVDQSTTTVVKQENTAIVTNKVDSTANTGNNNTNFNTGGAILVGTGDAEIKTNIVNELNTNSATVDCCQVGDTEVKVSGNGAYSENGAVLNAETKTLVFQDNLAKVRNDVDAVATTGGNTAVKNTDADIAIGTGDAKVTTNVATTANVNVAQVASALSAHNPSATFVISGNGAGTDNYITAALDKFTKVDQDNDAYITNDVDASATTGKNDAGFNTGGEVLVGTGHATVLADVDNAVNFNFADIDCGCTWDVLAKISGNGADPENEHHSFWKRFFNRPDSIITLTLDSGQIVGQDNGAFLYNDLEDLYAKTGKNSVNLNTGDVDGDPGIGTGDAYIRADLENSGNLNSVGNLPFSFPQMPQFPEIDFSFNFAALMAFFGFAYNG